MLNSANFDFKIKQGSNQPNGNESDNDELSVFELWQDTNGDRFQVHPHDTSGKFLVTCSILDSLMSSTKEKIVLVSYSTKVFNYLFTFQKLLGY